jgi:hydroxymethylglutaryl-CoA reductase
MKEEIENGHSRISGFYKKSVRKRLDLLVERGALRSATAEKLMQAEVLSLAEANCLIENVIGVCALPVGLALNFIVNGRERFIPMVVEEPSIVAGVSGAAKLARRSGGFKSRCNERLITGQVQLLGIESPVQSCQHLLECRQEIIARANLLHPRMVTRGGGVREMEVKLLPAQSRYEAALVVYLLMDSGDAMGANYVNSVCESIAPFLEELTGGRALLRILSNLTDRCLVRTTMTVPLPHLAVREYSARQVRDGVIAASHLAERDPYRAATHNKGIMNGVDAVAIATGNDWRAIEAAAHAYATRSGVYSPLTYWRVGEDEGLVGTLEMPMKVGTVGAQVSSLPHVQQLQELLQVDSAQELAEIIGAVGLAANFAALRALVTDGIGHGHLHLHARAVAFAAGARGSLLQPVISALMKEGEVKIWKAKQILSTVVDDVLGDRSDVGGVST